METYGMAAPDDDTTIDCYHQYIAQTNYRCELPDDGFRVGLQKDDWFSRNYPNSAEAYGGTDYRAAAPLAANSRRYSPRNGLYNTYNAVRSGGGDDFNSSHDYGNYGSPLEPQNRRRNIWGGF